MRLRFAAAPAFFATLFSTAAAQSTNTSSLTGTWSTGNGAVLTGVDFADPIANTFNYPTNAGISFSFTDSGYFEQAQFTWVSNATDPHCVQAVVIWQHGTYEILADGSITTDPSEFEADGRIQVQDACAATTSVISYYSQPGEYQSWIISVWRGKEMLQLAAFDGSLMPRMYRIANDPTAYMHANIALSNSTNSL